MIEIHGVTFRYPGQTEPALKGVDLRVRDGSVFGLLGPNGSGKTTLISILTGLLQPVSGTVRIDGRDLGRDLAAIQAFTSLVPQENAFYPTLTVTENLAFFASVQSINVADRATRISEALAITGLERASGQRAARLSGGMKRRLSIALGLLNRPRLLFLDEPTVGIDPQSRHFLLDAIRTINAAGTTVVYSSHYMDEVESLCDEIGILDNGTLLLQGSLRELLREAHVQRLRIDASMPLSAQQQSVLEHNFGARISGARIEVDACAAESLQGILEALRRAQISVAAVRYGAADLQELFLGLTRTALRDH